MSTSMLTEGRYAAHLLKYDKPGLVRSHNKTIRGVAEAAFPAYNEEHRRARHAFVLHAMNEVTLMEVRDHIQEEKISRHPDQYEDLIAGRALRRILETGDVVHA